ncbi:hypothetical protein [Paraburkholderia terrae]|uniref:hypothetical protein n=1 Tax=Paraburkholderia terrae TaxID=311230 RepID=UPI0033653CA7
MSFVSTPEIRDLQAYCGQQPFDAAYFKTLCEAVVARGHVAEILRQLARNASLQTVAQNSYLHDNGFTKLVVFRSDRCAVRLHLWDTLSSNDQIVSNIHNHRWNFFSRLLAGEYDQEQFAPSKAAADGERYFASRYVASADDYEVIPLGEILLQRSRRQRMLAPSSYYMAADVMHRVTVPARCLTATIVVQAQTLSASTTICSPHPIAGTGRQGKLAMTVDDVRSRLVLIATLNT